MPDTFPAYVARKENDQVTAAVEAVSRDELPPGDVLIRTAYSSLNYKDALAGTGHPGIVKRFPHVPGIDVSGTVEESTSGKFHKGDEVLATGYALGEAQWGGLAGMVRVPAEFVVPLPVRLSLFEAMALGTAGFTAAQSVSAIVEREIDPKRGPVVVTGASGGVGSISVALLAKAGYEVAAVTGKASAHDLLRRLGASEIIGRDEVNDDTNRPLLSARWSSAVDTVGGNTLATLLRSTDHRGVITACGLVAGVEFATTVYPFILRGITLVGIDSQKCPMPERRRIWQRLAGEWKLDALADITRTITLAQVGEEIQQMLAGKALGRVVVEPTMG